MNYKIQASAGHKNKAMYRTQTITGEITIKRRYTTNCPAYVWHEAIKSINGWQVMATVQWAGYNIERVSIDTPTMAYNFALSEVNSLYGAPMGRHNEGKPTGKIYDRRVYLTDGYDKGGAYWGNGPELRVSFNIDLTYVNFYRR